MEEIELMAKTGTPDPELLLLKFNEVKAIIDTNIITITKIKADLENRD